MRDAVLMLIAIELLFCFLGVKCGQGWRFPDDRKTIKDLEKSSETEDKSSGYRIIIPDVPTTSASTKSTVDAESSKSTTSSSMMSSTTLSAIESSTITSSVSPSTTTSTATSTSTPKTSSTTITSSPATTTTIGFRPPRYQEDSHSPYAHEYGNRRRMHHFHHSPHLY
ncbi:uncharacterized protein LOC132266183 [Phlebotomus argentipes]|uniref:uncharacterized protein LOC132266183 n=1 Tax=Phlebotomus argentipes TaxID=94469 RepID=UPI002892E5C5|nr:uncharacterized protein LOC132266183 [Phlebotomus argentipes]